MKIERRLQGVRGGAGDDGAAADRERDRRGLVQRRAVTASHRLQLQLLDQVSEGACVLCHPRGEELVLGAGRGSRGQSEKQRVAEQGPEIGVVVDAQPSKLGGQGGLPERRQRQPPGQGLLALDRRGIGIGGDAHHERAVLGEVRERSVQRTRRGRARTAAGDQQSCRRDKQDPSNTTRDEQAAHARDSCFGRTNELK